MDPTQKDEERAGDNPGLDLKKELEEQGLKRPPLWRQVLPYLIAAAILWWIFRGIELEDFTRALAGARPWVLLPALFGFTLVYAAADIMSYGFCYRWFVLPGITVGEMMKARLGAYLFHVLYTPLSTVANLAYLRRHKGAPVIWSLSANAFVSVHDLFSINLMITFALAANLVTPVVTALDPRWFFPVSIPWAVALGYALYWYTGIRDLPRLARITKSPILRSCYYGRPRHNLYIILARLLVAAAGGLSHWAALYAFGIEVPAAMVLVVAPLIVGSSILPISGAGFGGPQLVALILLPYAGGDRALITAYSISFSTCFTLGRVAIGLLFLPAFARDLERPGPLISTDPLAKDPVA